MVRSQNITTTIWLKHNGGYQDATAKTSTDTLKGQVKYWNHATSSNHPKCCRLSMHLSLQSLGMAPVNLAFVVFFFSRDRVVGQRTMDFR